MEETRVEDVETLDSHGEPGDGIQATSEAENPSSSSDSESDEEDVEDLQIETLEKALSDNPSNYEAHVQYIRSLRKFGHIEKLRQARESMNQLFPLSSKMWQEWAKDEASLSAGSEAFTEIEKIYERGVHEYLFVPLWCDYINFVQEHDKSVSQLTPVGVSKMRNLFESALTAAGLHITEGNKIWEAYREFEQAILRNIDDLNNEEKTKQVNRIRALFHRQLSVPLVDLGSTFMAYKLWEDEQGNAIDINTDKLDGIHSTVAPAYQKAMEMYNARIQYEDELSASDASDTDRLQQFMRYITFEESSGDPARVHLLYERAASEFPISSDIWLQYTSYLDRTLKVPSVLKSVYSRATRNCPWIRDLWVRYLLSLERMHACEEEINAVFEQSIRCVFSSFREYLDLFLTRVDGLRRRIGSIEDGLDNALIRDTFQRAVDYLSTQLVDMDDLLRLHAYWARLEANIGNDLVAARGVWESLIKKSGTILEVWKCYIAMEIEMGHINEARSIYKRCYSKRFPGAGSEDICHSWLRFEREYGTLEDLDRAVRKVTPRLEELMLFRAQQESKSVASSAAQKGSHAAKNASQKRKMAKAAHAKEPPAKRQKETASEPEESSYGDPTRKSGIMNDAGAADRVEEATSPNLMDTDSTIKQSLGDSNPKEPKMIFYTDKCTAFISNLRLEANEEHLREFFSDCGGVTAIRIVKDYTGRSKGIAYVDFQNDEHLAAAIAKNKQNLLGQKLHVARSDPKQSQKRASARSSRGRGRGADFRSDRSGKGDVSETSHVGSKETLSDRHGSHVNLMGKNTFAAPRSLIRPLGWSNKDLKTDESEEKPKSNDEFRKIFLKN